MQMAIGNELMYFMSDNVASEYNMPKTFSPVICLSCYRSSCRN